MGGPEVETVARPPLSNRPSGLAVCPRTPSINRGHARSERWNLGGDVKAVIFFRP